jgi:hypothetical protein
MPKDGRSTACKAQAAGESFARAATNPVTKQAQNAGHAPCLSRTRIYYLRQSLGEDGLVAFSAPTLPSANRERDPYWSALDRQIPKPSLIRAVPS